MSSPNFIPPRDAPGPDGKPPSRNVIFMFDGTGDEVDDDATNVVRFSRLLYNHPKEMDPELDKDGKPKKDFAIAPLVDPEGNKRQVVYYRKGIGMWRPGSKRSMIPFYGPVSRFVDKAIAWNFEDHVIDAYKTLTRDHKEGDKICLFGFSRGSYTARTVAAVVGLFGILPQNSRSDDKIFENIKDIYFGPTRNSFSSGSIAEFQVKKNEFLEQHRTVMVTIEFVGVWDTVNSVGVITTTGAMYTSSAPNLKTFRHAIALDERRARFDKAMWYKKKTDAEKLQVDTNVEQVWFSGAHCDVGGGSVRNDTKHNLANIPLRWMVRECFKMETGIIFVADELRSQMGMDPSCLYPIVKPRPAPLPLRADSIVETVASVTNSEKTCRVTPTSPEEEHDLWDSLAPIYDMLDIKWYMWSAFEQLIMKKWDPVRGDTAEANGGAGRRIYVDVPHKTHIFDKKVKVHRSVRTRMMAKSKDPKGPYVPAATLHVRGESISVDSDLVEWVD